MSIFNLKSDSNLVQGSELKIILNDIISPRLSARDFKWDKGYKWINNTNEGIVSIIKYDLIKGGCGTFSWGVYLDCVPKICGRKMKGIGSKSYLVQHLFEWTKEYASSFVGGNMDGGIALHWGRRKTKKSIEDLFNKIEPSMYEWLKRAVSINALIPVAEKQISDKGNYVIHAPRPDLILACLFIEAYEFEKANSIIDGLDIDDEIRIRMKKMCI